MSGWIKLHRDLMDKPIWTGSTAEQKVILVTLLMMANHSKKKWEWKGEVYEAKSGQMVTSLPSIAEKCGLGVSIQNIRTALKRFEKFNFLTDESTNKNRLITIVNWADYQRRDEELTDDLTGDQQAPNRQLTANKNDKNNKNDEEVLKDMDQPNDSSTKKRFIHPTLEQVAEYCEERKNTVDPQKWFDHYTSNGWKVGKNSMKDWKAAVRTWERSSFGKGRVSNAVNGGNDKDLYAGIDLRF